MQPASRRVDVQHSPVEVLNKDRIRRAFKQLTEPLLAFAQRLLRPDALQRAAAMVRQRLERVKIRLIVSPEPVALDRQDANDLRPVSDRHQYQ